MGYAEQLTYDWLLQLWVVRIEPFPVLQRLQLARQGQAGS